MGIYIALRLLPIPTEPLNVSRFVEAFMNGAVVYLVVGFTVRLVDGRCELWAERAAKTETKLDDHLESIPDAPRAAIAQRPNRHFVSIRESEYWIRDTRGTMKFQVACRCFPNLVSAACSTQPGSAVHDTEENPEERFALSHFSEPACRTRFA